jgi:hypothetical protein
MLNRITNAKNFDLLLTKKYAIMKKIIKAIVYNNEEVVGTEIRYSLFGITFYKKILLLPPKEIKGYEFIYRF